MTDNPRLAALRVFRVKSSVHLLQVNMPGKFPVAPITDAADYMSQYFQGVHDAAASVRPDVIRAAAGLLHDAIRHGGWIYACGNGGSAAISNHLHCDFAKSVRTGTNLRPRIHSLSAHMEMMTAIANDMSYDDVFAYQLSGVGQPGDVLITVSSSGNSENIVRSLCWARDNGMRTIALTGFDGGRSATLADINIHVSANNYGIIEDVHQSIMHILAQYIRQNAMPPDDISILKF